MRQPQIETVLLFYCVYVPRNLRICTILRLRCAFSESKDWVLISRGMQTIYRQYVAGIQRYADNMWLVYRGMQTICGWYAEVRRQYVGGIQRYADNVWVVYRSMQTICGWYIASFPGPAQLSVACSTEKQGISRAWYIFSCE